MRKSFADIVNETESEPGRRLLAKVPEWAPVLPDLQLPSRLNVEQCSSSATARYKAGIAARILDGRPGKRRLADLTGGLGVDAWAFSGIAYEVLYNEMDPALCGAVRHNFARLGVDNVTFRNTEIRPGTVREALDGFEPDLFFLDPARRSATGRKVFLLEECSPDLGALKDELLSICPSVLVKLSPMADISLLCRRLGNVTEIHILAVDGECKELLLRLDAGHAGPFRIAVSSIHDGLADTLSLEESDRELTCPRLELSGEEGLPALCGSWLFEPGAALMKSACHEAVCSRAGMRKLSPSSHLYVAAAPVSSLVPFGRFRRILEAVPLDKRTMADVGRRHPAAEVTARGIPMSSEQLRERLGVRSGGSVHIYGAATSVSGAAGRRLLIVTEVSG